MANSYDVQGAKQPKKTKPVVLYIDEIHGIQDQCLPNEMHNMVMNLYIFIGHALKNSPEYTWWRSPFILQVGSWRNIYICIPSLLFILLTSKRKENERLKIGTTRK